MKSHTQEHLTYKLYKAYILPHFEFCSSVWHFRRTRNTDKPEVLSKRILRFILGDYFSPHDSPLTRVNTNSFYNPPINFYAISLATLYHVLDSYHEITPVRFDICPPPLISTEKSKVCGRKANTSVSIFIFIIIHGRKTTFFVESSDSDIRKLVGMLCQKLLYKEDSKI